MTQLPLATKVGLQLVDMKADGTEADALISHTGYILSVLAHYLL